MGFENTIKELRKLKFKHSREFVGNFMEKWSDEKKEEFYKKNEPIYSAIEIAINCVKAVSDLQGALKLVGDYFEKLEN